MYSKYTTTNPERDAMAKRHRRNQRNKKIGNIITKIFGAIVAVIVGAFVLFGLVISNWPF